MSPSFKVDLSTSFGPNTNAWSNEIPLHAKSCPSRAPAAGLASSSPAHLARTLDILSLPHVKVKKICCIGAGYVGGPTCAVIANKNPNVQVTVVDLSQQRIDAWNSDRLPIYEPGLLDTVQAARDGTRTGRKQNLFFSTDVDRAIAEAELIFVSVNTPTKVTGTGAGRASELSYVESAIRKVAEVATGNKIIVEKSTVPCRTAESMREVLSAVGRPGVNFEILSNPEFLAEGTAITDLLSPDRILIGSLTTDAGMSAAASLAHIYAAWVPQDRIITMNLWSSELAKLAANALLAQRISSVNALSAVCEATGADIDEVSYACGLDSRIGPKMLKASVGFGGSCFKKDILSLAYISESLHLPEVAAYWKSVVDINEYQKDRFTKRIIRCLYNSLKNKKIAILGFAYKKNTGDTRESAAITIVQSLVAEEAKVSIYDPRVREEQIWQDIDGPYSERYGARDHVNVCSDVYEACADAHAIIILTEWDEFSNKDAAKDSRRPGYRSRTASTVHKALQPTSPGSFSGHDSDRSGSISPVDRIPTPSLQQPRMDWSRVAGTMRRPMFVFDGRNVVDAAKLEALGFRVECVGKTGTAL